MKYAIYFIAMVMFLFSFASTNLVAKGKTAKKIKFKPSPCTFSEKEYSVYKKHFRLSIGVLASKSQWNKVLQKLKDF